MGAFSRFTQKVTRTASNIAQGAAAVATIPIQFAGNTVSASAPALIGGVQSAGQVAGAATTVLQQNPALAGALSAAVPGLGGLFGGGSAGAVPSDGGGVFTGPTAPTSSGVPVWVWIVGGLGAVLAIVLLLRRKS